MEEFTKIIDKILEPEIAFTFGALMGFGLSLLTIFLIYIKK